MSFVRAINLAHADMVPVAGEPDNWVEALEKKYDFVTCDPGKWASGFAFWKNGKLVDVAYGTPAHQMPGILTIEKPVIYPGGKSKGNPNDLLDLAFEVGKLCKMFYGYSTVKPREWKGTIKKEIMLKRIVSKLTEEERVICDSLRLPKDKQKEVIDAIGIGLWLAKRL